LNAAPPPHLYLTLNFSERDALISSAPDSLQSTAPSNTDASSSERNASDREEEDESLLRTHAGSAGSNNGALQSAVRSALVYLRAAFVFASVCAHSASEAVARCVSRDSHGTYALAEPSTAAPSQSQTPFLRRPLVRVFMVVKLILISRFLLVRPPTLFFTTSLRFSTDGHSPPQIRYWSIMEVFGAAGSPSLRSHCPHSTIFYPSSFP
jgi:hypothetical protein